MLEASGEFVYINEPMNPQHPPGRSPGVLRAPIGHRFQYITNENEKEYIEPFREMLALRYHVVSELRANHAAADILRMAKYATAFTLGRIRNRRPLVDDPFAAFSAAWLAYRFQCQVLFVVRHPAAIVSSRKRLGHRIDFRHFLEQPLLIRDWLEPFVEEMRAMSRAPDDLVGQGSLLWRLIYHVATEVMKQSSRILVVRHEDLSHRPESEFSALFHSVGLPFTEHVRRAVVAATSGTDTSSRHSWSLSRYGLSRTGYRRLNSRAATVAWRRSLNGEEVARIRQITDSTAAHFYGDEDWAIRS
jgi:Sulfotransferase domain